MVLIGIRQQNISLCLSIVGGDKIEPDRLERPFVYVEDNESQVLSLAVKKGDESYIIFMSIKSR